MIKINLLPAEAGGKRAGGAAKAKKGSGALTPFVLLLVALYAGAAFMGWKLYDKWAKSQALVQQAKDSIARLDKQIKDREKRFKAQLAEAQEIEEKFAVVQALNPPNRLYWSEKLNQLAMAETKAAVYLTRLAVSETIEEVETEESRARRAAYDAKVKKPGSNEKPPPIVKMPIIKQVLTVEGVAYGTNSPQRLQQITLFMDALKNLQWTRKSGEKTTFFTGMKPDIDQLPHKVTQVGGVDVLQFGFRIAAAPQMNNPTAPPKPGGTPPAPPGAPAGGTKP